MMTDIDSIGQTPSSLERYLVLCVKSLECIQGAVCVYVMINLSLIGSCNLLATCETVKANVLLNLNAG